MRAQEQVDEGTTRTIEEILDRLCEAQSRETVAMINASRCATSADHRHARRMGDALLEAREAASEALCQLLVEAIRRPRAK